MVLQPTTKDNRNSMILDKIKQIKKSRTISDIYLNIDSISDLTMIVHQIKTINGDVKETNKIYFLPEQSKSKYNLSDKNLIRTIGNYVDYDAMIKEIDNINKEYKINDIYYSLYNSLVISISLTNKGYNLKPYPYKKIKNIIEIV